MLSLNRVQACPHYLRDLFIVDHDGGNPRKIAIAPGQIRDIKFSPDSSRFGSQFTIGKTHFFNLGGAIGRWRITSPVAGLELRMRELISDVGTIGHSSWFPRQYVRLRHKGLHD